MKTKLGTQASAHLTQVIGRPGIQEVVILAITLLLRLAELPYPLTGDSSIYAYVGWRIAEGELPYLHAWDHKPPGLPLLWAVAFKIMGTSLLSMRIFELGWSLLTAWGLLVLSRRMFGKRAGFALAALVVLYLNSYALSNGGLMTEAFTILPTVTALYFLLSSATQVQLSFTGTIKLFLAGTLLGAATLIKQPAIAPIGAIPLLWWARSDDTHRSWLWQLRFILSRSAIVGLGLSLPLLTTAFWLWYGGALNAVIYAVLDFNRGYVSSGLNDFVAWMPDRYGEFALLLLPFLALGSVGVMSGTVLPDQKRFVVGWLLLSVVALVAAGEHAGGHHLILVLLPLSLLGGWGLQNLLTQANLSTLPRSALVALLAFWGLALLPLLPGEIHRLKVAAIEVFMPQRRAEMYAVADYVRTVAQPSDTVLEVGASGMINFLSQRRSPSRYFWQPGDLPQSEYNRFMEDVLRNPPKLIVTRRSSIPHWLFEQLCAYELIQQSGIYQIYQCATSQSKSG